MQKRTPHHVKISFSGDTLTHFGGIYLLQSFFKRLQLRRHLQRALQFRQRNNQYTIAEEVLALIYPIALGLERIETTHLLKQNGVFQFVTDSIWLGKMNQLSTRLSLNGEKDPATIQRADQLIAWQSDENIKQLYSQIKDNPLIKWKDSIKKVVGLKVLTEPGIDR